MIFDIIKGGLKVFQLAKGGISSLKKKKATKQLAKQANTTAVNITPAEVAEYKDLPGVTVTTKKKSLFNRVVDGDTSLSQPTTWDSISNFKMPAFNVNHEVGKTASSPMVMIGIALAALAAVIFVTKKK